MRNFSWRERILTLLKCVGRFQLGINTMLILKWINIKINASSDLFKQFMLLCNLFSMLCWKNKQQVCSEFCMTSTMPFINKFQLIQNFLKTWLTCGKNNISHTPSISFLNKLKLSEVKVGASLKLLAEYNYKIRLKSWGMKLILGKNSK